MPSSYFPRLSRRAFAGASSLSLLTLGAGATSSASAQEGGALLGNKTKGNGPPLRVLGLGTGVTRVENSVAQANFRFSNTNTPHDPPDARDSVWIFAQGVGVVMTAPDPNPPKDDPGHVWIYRLNKTGVDGEWPAYTTAYLIGPLQEIFLRWPGDALVKFSIRPWMPGEK